MAKRTGLGGNLPWVRDTSKEADVQNAATAGATPEVEESKARSESKGEESRSKEGSQTLDTQTEAKTRSQNAGPSQRESPKIQKIGTSELQNFRTVEVLKSKTSEVPKFKTFEVKLSILLREDQLDFLEQMVRTLMSSRNSESKRERITKNTILRAYIDALRDIEFNAQNIPDEEELLRRLKASLISDSPKSE